MNISLDIPDAAIVKALRLAHDRGIAYWCTAVRSIPGRTFLDQSVKLLDQKYHWPLHDGRWVLSDHVVNERHVLTRPLLERGFHVMSKKNTPLLTLFLDGVSSYGEMGDWLIQYSLFGELRYAPGKDPGVGAVYVCSKCQVPQPCDCLAAARARHSLQ